MTTKVSDGPGSLDVSSWLAELHMECYKKHLEDYETIKVSFYWGYYVVACVVGS